MGNRANFFSRLKKYIINKDNGIIFKYIFKQLFIALFAFLFVLVGIAWITQILRLISFMVSSRISVMSFLYFTILLMPTILTVVLPIAVFSVILYVYNKLITDKEIVVMQSNGLDIKHLIKPAIIFMFLVTMFSYYLVIHLSPAFYLKFRDYKFKLTNSAIAMFIKYGEFTEVSKGLTLYVKESKKDLFLDIFIHDSRKPHNPRTIIASQGQLINTSDNSAVITLANGSVQEKKGDNYTFGTFENYTINMGLTHAKSTPSYKPKDLFINQLFFAKSLGFANDKNFHEYKLEIHRRFITPLYIIIFGLIALITMLRTSLNRRSNNMVIMISVICMILTQIFYIFLFDVLIKNNYFLWPIAYILTIFILGVLFYILISDNLAIRILKFHRNKKKFNNSSIGITKNYLFSITLILSIIYAQSLFAQFSKPKFDNDRKSITIGNKIDSAVFETDEILYDANTGLATTVGGVKSISPDNKSYFYTDNMIYNVPENLIMVSGDIILNKDGNIISTKDIVMTADFKQIQAGETKIKLSDGSVIKSESMVREYDNIHTLKNTTYTACPIYLKLNDTFSKCEHFNDVVNTMLSLDSNLLKNEELEKTPTWEIYSYKINQNTESKTISYKHALVYMWGVPVLYIPYLIHPDPTIKHSSGLLFPKIGTSTATGASVTLPVYIYTDPYSFLTISPMFNAKNKNLVLVKYKHNFKYFDFDYDLHSNLSNNKSNKLWYADLKSNFILSRIFKGRLNINRVSKDTYLRQYNFSNVAYLKSDVYVEGFLERSRLSIGGVSYQDLRSVGSYNFPTNDVVSIYPNLNYYGQTDGDEFGGFWAINFNTTTAKKHEINNYKNYRNTRITSSVLRQHNNILMNGVLLETALFARQDYYIAKDAFIYNPNSGMYSYLTDNAVKRSHVSASIMASYPFYKDGLFGMETIEPIVQFVTSPRRKTNWKIENLDSLDTELSDNNLFSMNRNPGYDLIETGNRINYAVKWGTYYYENNVSLMIGQSYSSYKNKEYSKYSGLLSDSGFSDVVGRITYSHRLFKLSYHTRIDNETSQINKSEFLFSTDMYRFNLYVDYLFLKDTHTPASINYEELYYKVSTKFTEKWAGYFNNRYSFNTNNIISYGVGAQYQNDCFSFSVEMERKYSYDRDYRGDKSIFFTFAFKNLGSFETKHSFNSNKRDETR